MISKVSDKKIQEINKMLKNGGLHLLIRSQKFDFRIAIICFTSKYLLLLLSYVWCGGGGWGECSVVLGALSSSENDRVDCFTLIGLWLSVFCV